MASQSTWVLLVSRVGDARGAVVEKVLHMMGRVLKARRGSSGSVNERVAAGNALWKPAVVVSWLQGLAAFVLRKKRVYKIGAHVELASSRRGSRGGISPLG